MTAREVEAALLTKCVAAARAGASAAHDSREANVFRLAAAVLKTHFPIESRNLLSASERYFQSHPDAKLEAADVIRRGWVTSMPRLRDMLSNRLSRQ